MTDDGPGGECEYSDFSYFPEAGKVCLFNIDPEQSHSAFLHAADKQERIELAPGEFKTIEA